MTDPQPAAGPLRRLLVQHFSDNDLRSLCQDLDVDYEALPGAGTEAKARELITFLAHRGRLADLIMAARRERPQVAWGAVGGGPAAMSAPTGADIHEIVQIGNPLIRALRGVSARISRVLQIGGGRIEIGDAPPPSQGGGRGVGRP